MADPLNVVIDLSHYNEVTSFSDIKASGIVGVIHKATQGLADRDPTYAFRRARAAAAGLWWGAYHFGTDADGAAQARFFLSVVNPGPQDLLALDFEQNGDDTMTLTQAEQFVTEVYNQTGRYPASTPTRWSEACLAAASTRRCGNAGCGAPNTVRP